MQTQVLLPNMSGKLNYQGEPVKSIGYYSHKTNKKSQSIAVHTLNFVGRIIIEGSIKEFPVNDSDWFVVKLDGKPYLEYNDYSFTNGNVIRKNYLFTFDANYVWLRAKIDRSYIDGMNLFLDEYNPTPRYTITASDVNQVVSKVPYSQESLNPIYDPEYYDGWKKNFASTNNKRLNKTTLGNVEKVLLCY